MKWHRSLFYLTLLLLPVQLGYHWWPQWAFVIGRRIDYLSPTLFLTDILVLLTVTAWLLADRSVIRALVTRAWPHRLFFLSVGLYVAANIVWSVNPAVTVLYWTRIAVLSAFVLYMVRTRPSFSCVVMALSVAAAYSSAIALAQLFLQHSLGGWFWFLGERTFSVSTPGIATANVCGIVGLPCSQLLRPYATFPHPNVLGGFLASVLLLRMIAIIRHPRRANIPVEIPLLALLFSGLAITLSRSAWVGAVAGTALIMVANRRTRTVIHPMVFLLPLILLFIFALPYFARLSVASESVLYRSDLIGSALAMFIRHPVTGVGGGAFITALPDVSLARYIWFLQPVHSIWLLGVDELGIVMVFLLGIAVWIFRRSFSSFAGIRAVPLVIILLIGLVDHYPATLQQGRLLTAVLFAVPFFRAGVQCEPWD